MTTNLSISEADYRATLSLYPSGVCVITSLLPDGTPVGMSISSFTSVSLQPPLVGFFPGSHSVTSAKIKEAGRFCANVLSAEQEALCRRFATQSPNKFDGVDFHISDNGLPILAGAIASIECTVESVTSAGDHDFVLGRVVALDTDNVKHPLVFFRSGYGQFQAAATCGA